MGTWLSSQGAFARVLGAQGILRDYMGDTMEGILWGQK